MPRRHRPRTRFRVAYVSPSVSQSLPWFAKELGILAKYDLTAEVLLITGSPRLVQSLIAGDVDFVFAGVAALTRARGKRSGSRNSGRLGQCFESKDHDQQDLEDSPHRGFKGRDHRSFTVRFGSGHLRAGRARAKRG